MSVFLTVNFKSSRDFLSIQIQLSLRRVCPLDSLCLPLHTHALWVWGLLPWLYWQVFGRQPLKLDCGQIQKEKINESQLLDTKSNTKISHLTTVSYLVWTIFVASMSPNNQIYLTYVKSTKRSNLGGILNPEKIWRTPGYITNLWRSQGRSWWGSFWNWSFQAYTLQLYSDVTKPLLGRVPFAYLQCLGAIQVC